MSTFGMRPSLGVRWLLLGAVLIGTAVFFGLAFLAIYPELRSGPNSSSPLQLLITVLHGLVFAGLAPWLLLTYFWGFCCLPRDWSIGAFAVVMSLALHYVVVAVMAHATTSMAALVAAAEVMGAIALVWYWQRHQSDGSVKF